MRMKQVHHATITRVINQLGISLSLMDFRSVGAGPKHEVQTVSSGTRGGGEHPRLSKQKNTPWTHQQDLCIPAM